MGFIIAFLLTCLGFPRSSTLTPGPTSAPYLFRIDLHCHQWNKQWYCWGFNKTGFVKESTDTNQWNIKRPNKKKYFEYKNSTLCTFLFRSNCIFIIFFVAIQKYKNASFDSQHQLYYVNNFVFKANVKLNKPIGTWSSARIAIARKICSTRFYYCSTAFEQ